MTVALEASGNYVFLLARSCFGHLTGFGCLDNYFFQVERTFMTPDPHPLFF
jgi:hypothetical protein